MTQGVIPGRRALQSNPFGNRGTNHPAGRPGLAGGLILTLLLLLGLAAGCGGGSSGSTAPPVPTGTGILKLVPPDACGGSPCTGTALSSVQISGPETLAPFTMNFGSPSTLPFTPPGAYTVSGATFQASTGDTLDCPSAGFTVASGKTTTVTFAITNDVCTVTVSGPV